MVGADLSPSPPSAMSGAWSLDEAGAGGALGASAASGSGSTAETRQQGKRALTGPCRHALGGKGKQGIMFCKTFSIRNESAHNRLAASAKRPKSIMPAQLMAAPKSKL